MHFKIQLCYVVHIIYGLFIDVQDCFDLQKIRNDVSSAVVLHTENMAGNSLTLSFYP